MSVDLEILNEFRAESKALLDELEDVVNQLESVDPKAGFPDALLTEFAQKIDRIMGAVKTIALLEPNHPGFGAIGKLAELCKSIGYKAAEKKDAALLPIFSAFWADTIEVVSNLISCVEDAEKSRKIASEFAPVLAQRLAWLKSKIEK